MPIDDVAVSRSIIEAYNKKLLGSSCNLTYST
jgi:hypothetical protein